MSENENKNVKVKDFFKPTRNKWYIFLAILAISLIILFLIGPLPDYIIDIFIPAAYLVHYMNMDLT